MKRTIAILLAACLWLSIFTPTDTEAADGERDYLRGIWVSSVANLDYPSKSGLDTAELKAEADEIIAVCLETGMNTVFFQVRPCADALYNSKIFPKSVFLTGESTYDELDFDPLEYMCRIAHENGIELHAWINPYRVTRRGEEEYLAFDPESPQRRHTEYLLKASDGNYFFNPALPEVRRLITDGVTEIIENYDIDGIHFDDYFYPDADYDDSEQFAESDFTRVDEWRVENVNALVRQVRDAVKSADASLAFGISPRGVWANDYENSRGSATRGGGSLTEIYCDSLRFIDEGWVDYICPQIYWNIGYSAADYAVLAAWWANAVEGTDVKLYIGMGDYRTYGASQDSVWYGTDELARQLALNRTYPRISGEVHFRYKLIVANPALRALYADEYGGASPDSAGTITPSAEKMREIIVLILLKILTGR